MLHPQNGQSRARRGAVLILVIPIVVLALALAAVAVGPVTDTSQSIQSKLDRERAAGAAEAVANVAVADLWSRYQVAVEGDVSLFTFRDHLDAMGLVADINAQTFLEVQDQLGLPLGPSGTPELEGVEVEWIRISRADHLESTDIVIDVSTFLRRGNRTGEGKGGARGRVREGFSFGFPEFEGLEYALLSNNLKCLMCHTRVDNAARFYNEDRDLAGTFDAVKVGSLGEFRLREDPRSKIAGSLLLGGEALLANGEPLTNWGSLSFEALAPGADGDMSKISADSIGRPVYSDPLLFDPNRPDSPANVYPDFFAHADSVEGLKLPESFPSPFPDKGGVSESTGEPNEADAGNRIVDDSEFDHATQGSNGKISGGAISVLAGGERVRSEVDVDRIMAGGEEAIADVVEGHVYLHGTEESPLILEGDIAIDGDVILSGYVKGEGSIKARGNVYVPGDLVYADGGGEERTFGVAGDGTKNNLAIAAGGNVVVGDFYRRNRGSGSEVTGEQTAGWNFTLDQISLFNLGEWTKAQEQLPTGEKYWGQTGTRTAKRQVMEKKITKHGQWQRNTESYLIYVKVGTNWEWRWHWRFIEGYFWHEWTTEEWVWNGKWEDYQEPVYGWIDVLGPNPEFDPHHIPRYYTFKEGEEFPIFNRGGTYDEATGKYILPKEAPGDWDDRYITVVDPADPTDKTLFDESGKPTAVVSSIGPTDNWIEDGQLLRDIIHDRLQATRDHESGRAIEVDATIYSANAIMGLAPRRRTTLTNGEMIFNGSLVGADMGILASRRLQINYDERGAGQLSIRADRGLELQGTYSIPIEGIE